MNGVLNQVASVLERRFILVAFLPVLIFVVALSAVAIAASGRGSAALSAWNQLLASVQVMAILSSLALVWLLAGFVDSQLRNLTQVYEGYTLKTVAPRLAARAEAWHESRRQELNPVVLVQAPPGVEQIDHKNAAAKDEPASRYSEEPFVLYPKAPAEVLPTRLGNIIRAAEDYSESRYGVDYLIVWPRLAHICSERFVRDYEVVRANVDFLLVVSSLSAGFALLSGGIVLVQSGPVLLFVACVLGGFGLAHFAYSAAIAAAIEYGEQIRASMDLYRLELLQQLWFRQPRSANEEAAQWREFSDFLRKGHNRRTRYSPPTPPSEPSREA